MGDAVVLQVCAGVITGAVLWLVPRAARTFSGVLAAAQAVERAAPALRGLQSDAERIGPMLDRLELVVSDGERRRLGAS